MLAGALIPPPYLRIGGLPLFLLGCLLIGAGLLPYRKLTRLEVTPDTITSTDSSLLFAKGGKKALEIPHNAIERITFLSTPSFYGWALFLKHPIEHKIKVLDPRFPLKAFLKKSCCRNCDLFFPYFTEKSLKDLLESDHEA